MDIINTKLKLVPTKPGCYQMKDKDGLVIYVGKAKNLKNRLSSYFRGQKEGKTKKLVEEIYDFEYIVVSSEKEAFILELNLIKKYDPKYNVLMRDDKSYPYIEITNDPVFRLKIVHNLNKKKHKERLFGPYPNVKAAKDVVNMLNRLYPIPKCHRYEKDVCLYYHIHECLGYCKYNIDRNIVDNYYKEIESFLKGNTKEVYLKLEQEMYAASSKLNFEKAKYYKDLMDSINITSLKQEVEINDTKDIDIFGYYMDKHYLSVVCFFVRGGKIVERHNKIMPLIEDIFEDLTNYIGSFYTKDVLIPSELLVPTECDYLLLQEILETNVLIPKKGNKKNILDMASLNAKILLEEKFKIIEKDILRSEGANLELKELLQLDKLNRIEIFDNSNLFGTFNVSGMVVFKDGKPSKNDYRKYKISIDKNDDYHTMKEVIYRRYYKVLMDDIPKPDLIIVDGGIQQINGAKEVLDSLNLNITVVGLKKDDRHHTKSLMTKELKEINIIKQSNLFHYLEYMQEEVHNYVINYHRKLRNKGAFSSYLDDIEGIGPSRKKELLKRFHSLEEMKNASLETLEEILPSKTAKILKKFLENY